MDKSSDTNPTGTGMAGGAVAPGEETPRSLKTAVPAPSGIVPVLQAYADLTRIHFFFAWPLLFCSGLMLAAATYGTFSWWLLAKGALIGFLGFEAGFVLNDYIDRDIDRRDIEHLRLTKYWRLFGRRPIPAGSVSPQAAFRLFALLFALTLLLIATLPYPNCVFVFAIMVFSYAVEVFYQIKKRNQSFPVAQLVGRTDFALFPVAGYLCAGYPDTTALAYFVFFYPFAMAHLGVNDLIDIANDRVRQLRTIPVLYGINGTVFWIGGFSIFHAITAAVFFQYTGMIAGMGMITGLILLLVANILILRGRDPDSAMKTLPLFHVTMVVYAGAILLDAARRLGVW
jgi:4-hydroxybenzoate polyprenyltransferase